jgi:hypothetical protein
VFVVATNKRSITVVMVIAALVVLAQCADEPAVETTPGLMAAAVSIDGWQLDEEPLIYIGDTLFEMINGGAELYHRFGFVQALAAQYSGPEGRSIALEVFEMGDEAGARNIYAEKTGGTGEPLDIGDEAAGESYYLNVRTGRYLVTITGFESDQETTDGLMMLARAVAEQLGGVQ